MTMAVASYRSSGEIDQEEGTNTLLAQGDRQEILRRNDAPSIVEATPGDVDMNDASMVVASGGVALDGTAVAGVEDVRLARQERPASLKRPNKTSKDGCKDSDGGVEDGAARVFGSLPRLSSAGYSAKLRLDKMAHEVSAHYKAEFCVIALHRSDGGLSVIAHYGGIHKEAVENARATDLNAFSFFRHHVARDLPIIIEDTHEFETLKDDPLVVDHPKIRFYAAAPLSMGSGNYSGTISIGSKKSRRFRLEAAGILRQKAAEAVAIMRSSSWASSHPAV